jgi:hypothetical protein
MAHGKTSATKMYFAGVNGGDLELVTEGQRVLVSFADYQRQPTLWEKHRKLLEGGHWRGAVLDSGAFTELADAKRIEKRMSAMDPIPPRSEWPVPFAIKLEAYCAFVAKWGHLFDWCANLDSIEGDVDRSNANLEAIVSAAKPGTRIVPVFHEGEDLDQLKLCVQAARDNGGLIAVGAQRPKGKLRPTQVVKFLHQVLADLKALDATDLEVHGFGFPRYAGAFAPKGSPVGGFALPSVDSTSWIAEACAAFRAGCTRTRLEAFQAVVDSYQGAGFAMGSEIGLPIWGVDYDHEAAADPSAHGQARTVSSRLAAIVEALSIAA